MVQKFLARRAYHMINFFLNYVQTNTKSDEIRNEIESENLLEFAKSVTHFLITRFFQQNENL